MEFVKYKSRTGLRTDVNHFAKECWLSQLSIESVVMVNLFYKSWEIHTTEVVVI